MPNEVNEKPKRGIIAAVQLPGVSDTEFDSSLAELRDLAKTLGFEIVRIFTQKLPTFNNTAYLGSGKRDEIRRYIHNEPDDLAQSGESEVAPTDAEPIDMIFVDHEISPSQTRNLEKEIGCQVMDRTMVILEIFHRHARSSAARAQVEIARLGYMAPRLREAAKLAGPQGRQRSGVGGRGAGESLTETDRRKIRERIAELKKEIAVMESGRETQRARRQEGQGLAIVALVGYTNAGKSTLMRVLTGSQVLVANKLFATLDTTVRSLHPETSPRVLISDTVGFIKNLPHGLVASFKSTLNEALDASLLLHVIDASDPGMERQLEVTERVLEEIGAEAVPRLRVFNKLDNVGDPDAQAELAAELWNRYPGCVVMSARHPEDVAKLREKILEFFHRHFVEAELYVPWSAQQVRSEIYASCTVLKEHSDEQGVTLHVQGETNALDGLRAKLGQAGAP